MSDTPITSKNIERDSKIDKSLDELVKEGKKRGPRKITRRERRREGWREKIQKTKRMEKALGINRRQRQPFKKQTQQPTQRRRQNTAKKELDPKDIKITVKNEFYRRPPRQNRRIQQNNAQQTRQPTYSEPEIRVTLTDDKVVDQPPQQSSIPLSQRFSAIQTNDDTSYD